MTKKNTKNVDLNTKQDSSPNDNKELRIDKKFVLSLLSFIVTILAAVPTILHISYASRAEKYYGIHRFFLRQNTFGDFGTLIALIFAIIILWIFPFVIKKLWEGVLENKIINKLINLIFSIGLAFLAYIYMFFSFTILFAKEQETFQGNIFIYGVTIFIGAISGVIYYNILEKDFMVTSERSKEDLMTGSFCSRKEKRTQEVILVLYGFIFLVAFISLLFTGNKVSPFKPENILSYEILLDEKSEYNIVVGNHDGLAVLMKGNIEGDRLEIKKGFHSLESIENRPIEYRHFEEVIIVDKNKE